MRLRQSNGFANAGAALAVVRVCRVQGDGSAADGDVLAVEEPLAIRLGCTAGGQWTRRGVSITMRTPGHDDDLAVGFLFTEGIITAPDQIAAVHGCMTGKAVHVDLRPDVAVDLARLERHFATTSSCGVCGKTSLAALHGAVPAPVTGDCLEVDAAVIHGLPATLRAAQTIFDRTGGLHAAGLFDRHGMLLCLREDVGRHNALDKLIGCQFRAGHMPLTASVLLVSGRVSFELVQKAAVAGIPIVAAVGAPSSLAVELAGKHGLTLLGFVRADRFNIYTGADRIGRIDD